MLELERKPDFEKTLARFEAWWDRQIIDRPPVDGLHVGRDHPPRHPVPEKKHATLREGWFDFEYAIEQLEANLDGAVFVGDSFPRFWPNLGPELCATVFGADLEFQPETTYSRPIVKSCRDILELKPNLDNPYWNAIRRATDLSLERGRGKWITGLTDLHTNGDLVAALRNPQDMCLDMATDLEGVRAACDYVTRSAFALMYEDLWTRISACGQPATTWCPVLHAGRMYVTSCDAICLFSTPMFKEAVLPSIVWEMRYLDRNLFHLDGPGAIRHLDALLDLPELDAVQWVRGAGHGRAADWIDVYKRIQARGKGIQLMASDIADAKAVAEHLRPEGVWFSVGGSYCREEAEAFLKWTERWAAGKA